MRVAPPSTAAVSSTSDRVNWVVTALEAHVRGRVGAPAAIVSAIEDALRPFGVCITDLPVTPPHLLVLIQAAK